MGIEDMRIVNGIELDDCVDEPIDKDMDVDNDQVELPPNGGYVYPKFADITERASAQRLEERLRFCLDGHPKSELWGENGLIAATMRCVYAIKQIEDLVTTDHETKESFIHRVRGILGHNTNDPRRESGASDS